jgi:hypothetical protein
LQASSKILQHINLIACTIAHLQRFASFATPTHQNLRNGCFLSKKTIVATKFQSKQEQSLLFKNSAINRTRPKNRPLQKISSQTNKLTIFTKNINFSNFSVTNYWLDEHIKNAQAFGEEQ